MKYEHSVSDEPLNIIEQECEYRVGDLATSRFRRLFNEIDALRAEVAALKADYELCRYNKDPLMKRQARLEDELTELRALRDRLIAIPRGPNQAVWFDDILALIATAEALAATKEV